MGKRKEISPNPLFIQWLEEWITEAEEKGLNSKWTFKKALASIKRYPLPIRSGKEAKILENIGDGIAKKLDKKLEEYLNNGGDMSDLHKVAGEPSQPSKRKRRSNNDDNFRMPKNPEMTSPKNYFPKYRSGPYALLITLHQESKKLTYTGFLTKVELQKLAQPLCDASFSIPDPGSHYTAWSTMGMLLRKGLVLKWSNPAKFHITSTGCELAETLLEGTAVMFDNSRAQNSGELKSPRGKQPHRPATEKQTSPKCQQQEKSKNLPNVHSSPTSSTNPPAAVKGILNSPSLSTLAESTIQNKGNETFKASSHFARLQEQLNKRTRQDVPQRSTQVSKTVTNIPNIERNSDAISRESERNPTPTTSPTSSTSRDSLRYWYVNENNTRSVLKPQALVTIDDSLGVGFLVNVRRRDLELSNITFKIDLTRSPRDGFVFAFIADKDAGEIAQIPEESNITEVIPTSSISISSHSTSQNKNSALTSTSKTTTSKQSKSDTFKTSIREQDLEEVSERIQDGTTQEKNILRKKKKIESKTNENQNMKKFMGRTQDGSTTEKIIDVERKCSTERKNFKEDEKERNAPSTFPNVQTTTATTNFQNLNSDSEQDPPRCYPDFQPKPLFTFQPGTFDVLLLVDTVEASGGGRRKKEMAENLMKIGVKMEIRKLQVGDFLWIAKERFGERRELVLDFVVERKRMDDLASSIIDGRFKEQKFRLKSCGLKKLIYLVEQYGSVEHFIVPQATLKQAIMNTQVIDDLFIKETADIHDSVQYLRVLTNQIVKLYKNKTLHGIEVSKVKDMKGNIDFGQIISKHEQYLIRFDEFSANTDKNKVLTVRELFCKQLMQMKGVSVDRAVAIVDLYPTPTRLVEAFSSIPSHNEKMNLLTDVTFGKSKRKIGAHISKQIYLHYTTLQNPS